MIPESQFDPLDHLAVRYRRYAIAFVFCVDLILDHYYSGIVVGDIYLVSFFDEMLNARGAGLVGYSYSDRSVEQFLRIEAIVNLFVL